jgi:hypothetical protein
MYRKLNFSFLIIVLIISTISTYAQNEEDVE